MSNRMLIESDPHETRVAVLEDERLAEISVDRSDRRGHVGNVYKGKVTRVLTGMQAAFVDVGLERDAFLYVDDATPPTRLVEELQEGETVERHSAPTIRDLVRQNDEILVQVLRDPLPQKGARVTTQVALPSRFLVLMPGVDRFAVSRKIADEEERQRLRQLVEDLDAEHGLIVRTAGDGQGPAEFTRDYEELARTWEEIERRAAQAKAPSLVHRDLDPAQRFVRDVLSPSFSEILVQGREAFRSVVGFLEGVQPALAERVMEWTDESPLFDQFEIEEQIEAALRSRVWLRSGGYLVIHPTEALVAIDINTGRYVGGVDLEETVFRTNLEAAVEVVRQIRLRDLGGIIVVDFIDMESPENQRAVFETLQAELEKDRARSKVLNLSDFGLAEITRKRSRANLERVLTVACPDCRGRGRVKSPLTVCLDLRRSVLRQSRRLAGRDVVIEVHPSVEPVLCDADLGIVGELEEALGGRVSVHGNAALDRGQFEIS